MRKDDDLFWGVLSAIVIAGFIAVVFFNVASGKSDKTTKECVTTDIAEYYEQTCWFEDGRVTFEQEWKPNV